MTTVKSIATAAKISRNTALLADLPHHVRAVKINRLCGSSMQAIHDTSRSIMVGDAQISLVGGVEHMGAYPDAP